MIATLILFVTSINSNTCVSYSNTCNPCPKTISTVFGNVTEENSLVLDLLEHKSLQRLRSIDQYGPLIYFSRYYPKFSRYEHSLGVYALLKRYKVSMEEQIAGLMHDISHTAFSHLADYVLQSYHKHTESYQDDIHDDFLINMGIDSIIKNYNLQLVDISPKNLKYVALEQEFPDMNADRIEYNLHTGLIFNDLSAKDIEQILNALQFKNGRWYFTDIQQAKKFAKLSTYYTRNFWGGKNSVALYVVFAATLKYSIDKGIISPDHLRYGVDDDIIDILHSSHDPLIIDLLSLLINIEDHCIVSKSSNRHINVSIKMRGIDPLILHEGKLQRLSSVCLNHKQDLEDTDSFAKKGVNLKFVGVKTQILDLIHEMQKI